MYLAYDGIVFDVLLLNGWEQTAIMSDDGADFLYWHHIIDVTCIVNPQVTSEIVMPKKIVAKDDAGKEQRLVRNANKEINAILKQKDLLPKYTPRTDVDENGDSVQTPITSDSKTVSVSAVPDPAGKSNFYFDSFGAISQKAAEGVPSYPQVRYAGRGIPYDTDLAEKTGPIRDQVSIDWERHLPTELLKISPARIDNTVVEFSDTPENELILGRVPRAVKINADIDGRPKLPREPDPEAKIRRVVFPGNPSLPYGDTELRDRLQVPRRKLKIWVNTGVNGSPEFILNLPYDGCTVDAKDGPKCVDMNMIAIHGNITGVKRLVFECNESLPLFYGKDKDDTRVSRKPKIIVASGDSNIGLLGGAASVVGGDVQFLDKILKGIEKEDNLIPPKPKKKLEVLTPPIISNRWTMRQVPDTELHTNTIVISGKAVFRMDVLSRMKITPDQLRPYIMPPVALGYIRKPPEVSVNSLGNEVEYTIIDEQQILNNPGGQRWGVHSVVFTQSLLSNNPLDVGEVVKDPGENGMKSNQPPAQSPESRMKGKDGSGSSMRSN